MFRDQKQQHAASRALAAMANADEFWSDKSGPTARALLVLDEGKEDYFYLSSGQALLLRIAVDFWNSRGHADFGKMLAVLDNHNLRAVAELMIALVDSGSDGGVAIDAWVAKYGRPSCTRCGKRLAQNEAYDETNCRDGQSHVWP
jgi:hypothetical protein